MATTPGGLRSFNIKVLNDHLSLFASRESMFTLQVSDGFSERVLYWWNGRLFILSSGERSGPGLAEHLVRAGKLAAKDAEAIVEESRRTRTSLEEALLSRQVLTHVEYEMAMRRLVQDELFDLVFWEDALFLSYEAPPPSDFFAAEPFILSAEIPPGQLVEDLTAWIRKWVAWKPIVKSDQARIRLEGAAPVHPEGTGESEAPPPILAACRKGATLRELRHGVDMELPDLCDQVARFIEARRLSLSDEARPAMTPQQAIEKLEGILPSAVGKDLVRLKLANLHRKAKRPDKACSHFQTVADQAAARADWALASDCLRSILSVRPHDFGALRQLIKIHTDRGLTKQAIAAAMHFSQALLRERKADEMKAIAEIISGLPGAQLAAQEVRTDLKLLAGEVERAIEEYQGIADRHEEAGDLERALQLLGKAVELDPGNDDLKRRLLGLKQRAHGSALVPAARGRSRGALRRARERLGRAAASLKISLPIAAGALIMGVLLYYAIQLPTGSSLDVEAIVIDSRRPEPPREIPKEERPKLVVKIPVERLAPALRGGASTEPPGSAGHEKEKDEEIPPPGPPPAEEPGPAPDPALAEVEPEEPPPAESADGVPSPSGDAPVPPPLSGETAREPASAAVAPPAPELRMPAALLFEDALPPRPCPRHGLHSQVSRRLEGEKMIRFAHECTLRIEDARTGEILLDLEAPEGARWAHDPRGERVFAWRPGQPVTVFTASPRSSTTIDGWKVPPGTVALAGAGTLAALRLGDVTKLVRLEDGAEVRSRSLEAWSDGFFDGSRLLLRREAKTGGGEGKPWIVLDVDTLAIIQEPEAGTAAGGEGARGEDEGEVPAPVPDLEEREGVDGAAPPEDQES
jgi:tetratricopeptide (TPR) repeat protein